MKVYKLFGSSASSQDAVAQLDIQRSGTIVAIAFSTGATATADSEITWECSFSSARQPSVNNTVGPIGEIRNRIDFSVETDRFANYSIAGTGIPVGVGDRLYLHTNVGGALSANSCSCYLHVME